MALGRAIRFAQSIICEVSDRIRSPPPPSLARKRALAHDGVGHVVASVGEAIGLLAFSSLAATRQWLGTDEAKRFTRAYRKARAWLIDTPAAKVTEVQASFFPGIHRDVLTQTIATYQKLGCWTPHVEITRPAFEVTLDVFQYAGLITKRHKYEDVIAQPPA